MALLNENLRVSEGIENHAAIGASNVVNASKSVCETVGVVACNVCETVGVVACNGEASSEAGGDQEDLPVVKVHSVQTPYSLECCVLINSREVQAIIDKGAMATSILTSIALTLSGIELTGECACWQRHWDAWWLDVIS